jgi:nondiscriminating glutamyl-tRNA synthetase
MRTRFAPSPTGDLHIGGARTALFNFLLAKKDGGKFILRIEDTDQERNQLFFIERQFEDLCWLGIIPDESIFREGSFKPYQQSQRTEIYQKYIKNLLGEKKAYYCFCSRGSLLKEKEEYLRKEKKSNYKYSRICLNLSEEEVSNFLAQDKSHLVRFRVDENKNYLIKDLVRGEVVFAGKDIEDFVICRSNGMPLLNFVVVVDDHLMEISHVLRGEEHLSNTSKQLILYESFGWKVPEFGHLSLILNKEKKKLSKRDKETGQFQLITQLKKMGYLPEAINNYLLFLGWHPKNSVEEFFTLGEAIENFELEGLNSRGAVYNLEKLNWYNNIYIQKLTKAKFLEFSWNFLRENYEMVGNEEREKVEKLALSYRSQINCFQDLVELTKWFFNKSDVEIEEEEIFSVIKTKFSQLKSWKEEEIREILLKNAEKKAFLAIRKKLTGEKKGLELIKIIYLLGREETISRL